MVVTCNNLRQTTLKFHAATKNNPKYAELMICAGSKPDQMLVTKRTVELDDAGSRRMSNDLDELMRRIEDINAKPAIDATPADIDDLIEISSLFPRQKGQRRKPAKPQAVDISQVMMKLTKPKTEVKITRRF